MTHATERLVLTKGTHFDALLATRSAIAHNRVKERIHENEDLRRTSGPSRENCPMAGLDRFLLIRE